MPDFLQTHSENWIKYFHSHGYVDVTPLAAGVEGAVYDLGHDLISKVWAKKSHKEIYLMQAFYVDVANASLPFETPEIIEIHNVEGTSVTIERKLQGQPLQCYLSPGAIQPDNKAVEPIESVIHGDLFPENILVDRRGRLAAVLDFGFMSTCGDPRLDAAISAAIFDMYGLHSETTTDSLTKRFAKELGYDVKTLILYRTAYAFATNNYFTSDGSDGHFKWCVNILNKSDIT